MREPKRWPHPPDQLGGDLRGAGRASDGADASGIISPLCDRAPGLRTQCASEGAALPCQDSNNCTGTPPQDTPRTLDITHKLDQWERGEIKDLYSPASKRTAFALQVNVQAMCEEFGIEKVGFLTLTFAEHILDAREAQRRMHSLTTHVLAPRYGRCIRVIERQKSGRIHYHLLVNVGADIRSGVEFGEFAKGDYRSAPPSLRKEWAFWRSTAKQYGFGRTELLPIRSSTEAIGRYVGKYIAKHLGKREVRDKGIRLVTYTGGKTASVRFAWVSPGAAQWRANLGAFVRMLHDANAIPSPTLEAAAKRLGPKWMWHFRDSIMTMPLDHTRGSE